MADDDRLSDIPDADEGPLTWDPERKTFVAASSDHADATDPDSDDHPGPDVEADAAGPASEVDDRRITVAAPGPSGASPPPRRPPVVVEPGTTSEAAPPPRPWSEQPAPSTSSPAPGSSRAAVRSGDGTARPIDSRRVAPGVAPPRVEAPKPGPSGPATPPPASPSWRQRWPWKRIALTSVAVFVVFLLLGLSVAFLQFQRVKTVDVSPVLASGGRGTNYLIVGSDTRAGVDPDAPDAGAILGDGVSASDPQRSDTMLILRLEGGSASMLSVPRDLWVTIAETGERQRINAAFNGGPQRLIATITDQLGIPIHHYLEIDFVSFRDLVDGLGGITIDFPNPAFDRNSGLQIDTAGSHQLDGEQALAYVRSRYYTEIIDGRNRPDPTGDIGRTSRQQQFLSAVMDKAGGSRNPFTLIQVSNALVGGLTIDDDLSFFAALSLVRRMGGLDPTPTALPVRNFRTGAGASVLDLVQPGADEVLRQFGSSGARL